MSGVSLQEFFVAVERRLARLTESGETSFQVKVCGQVIELRFLTEQDAKAAKASLLGRVCGKVCKPDATFYYWADDCAKYVGEANRTKMLKVTEGDSYILFTPYRGITGVNTTEKSFYRCIPAQHAESTPVFSHAVQKLFFLWARSLGMLMFHAAAVGVDGQGVLIAGRSGSGKSTLSVGCMLAGMDFVADDYVIVSNKGPLFAYPLYSNIMLNIDVLESLNLNIPASFRVNSQKGGKLSFDLPERIFRPRIKINAIIAPSFDDSSGPSIAQIPPGGAITRMVYSTLQQMGFVRDPEPVRAMTQRLMGIPVYEMRLSTDLQKNVKALRKFIEEEL